MNRLFKNKHPPNTSPPTSPIFNITEILDIIFCFLDECSIRKSVLLVCRLWYHLNNHRVLREVRWDWRWKRHKLENALARLPGARSFTCTCMALFGEVDDAIFTIMNALRQQETLYQNLLDKQSRQQQQQQQQQRGTWKQLWRRDPVLPNISPLRELELFSFRIPGDNLTGHMFRFPATLTSLKFTGGVYAGTIFWIDQILTDCPLLEVFHAGSGGPILVNGPWVPPTHNQAQPLRLQSLVLQSAKLDQDGLENLLSVTPLLQELKLIELLAGTRLIFNDLPDSRYDWNRLYHRLVTLALPLRSVQFTVHCGGRMPSAQVRQRMIELCPRDATNTEWSFSPMDISATLLQELTVVHNNVTVLELCVPRVWPRTFAACTIGRFTEGLQLLQQYLCESPNLVRLKCLTGAILLEKLDLYHRARYTDLALGPDREWSHQAGSTTVSKNQKKQVWACRNLRSLEVEVHSHGYERLIWPVQSRILFGYIATVCPKLEELDLKLPSYCLQRGAAAHTRRTVLHIQLEGGLCLLANMKYLKTLKLERGAGGAQDEESNIQKFDISWITLDGLNREKHRVRRRQTIAQWTQKLETEQQLEEKYVLSTEPQQQEQRQGEDSEDEKLQESLHTLGLLSEVKKVIESMDTPEFRCFPSLERISFGGAFEQRPADEIKRVFPRWYQGG